MPRSYRLFFIAAFGWLSLAAGSVPDSAKQADTSQSIERSLNSIAAAQDKLAKESGAGEYQAPCGDGQYNNKSDLCAQWYAARAARDAADWAWWALAVGIVGAFGIVAALALTVDSNRIARDTAKRQLRAYVSLDSINSSFLSDAEGDAFWKIQVSWRNGGITPAIGLRGAVRWQDFEGEMPSDFNFEIVDIKTGALPVGPGGQVSSVCPEDIPRWVIQATEAGMRRTYVWGFAEYEDVFRQGKKHRTEGAFELCVDTLADGQLGVMFLPLNMHNKMD